MSEMNELERARENSYLKLREASTTLWGEERSGEVESTLRIASDAIARLSLFKFDHTDSPGFFLGDFGVDAESTNMEKAGE